jgi:GDP-4-dehydro-6-deoxy-D-mannose reductase
VRVEGTLCPHPGRDGYGHAVRVLVTGSRGFVGTWLMRHLAEVGDDAVGLDAEVDVTDAGALAEAIALHAPEAVCHLAAQASVGRSWSEARATFEVNTVGVLNLLEAAHAAPSRPRVLLVSSAEVYGKVAPSELPLREDHAFRPASPYAVSKASAELLGLQAWLGRDLEVVRARPFNHTGPGQPPDYVVPALARQVAEAVRSGAESLQVGNLAARRDLTDVRDVVRAYRLLLTDGRPGEVYNVCRGRSEIIEDVAHRLLALAGVDLPLVVDQARMRPVDLPDLRGDPSRLHEATGWQPTIELDQTLRDVLGAFAGAGGTAAS